MSRENVWKYFPPNYDEIYVIHTFDDGNECYQNESIINEWVMFGNWVGKCALVNRYDTTIRIYSISQWKFTKREIEPIKCIR